VVRVIGVGDNTVDKYLHLRKMFPGGNAVNVAVLARRYAHPASYLGWLGDDAHGHLLLSALREEGVDTSRCRLVDGPNAYCEVSLIDGDRVFGQASPGVSAQIALTDDDLDFISKHQLVHTSIYSHIRRDLHKLSNASPCLSFDFSEDWNRDLLTEMAPWIDIAILSYPDHSLVETEDLMHWVLRQGPGFVLVTRGQEGATACDGQRMYRQGIKGTKIVDTLGAGDAFAARFLVEYLDGLPVEVALEKAAESAAETCSYYGAFGHGVPF
jgi:fructoselysine 6-kinase